MMGWTSECLIEVPGLLVPTQPVELPPKERGRLVYNSAGRETEHIADEGQVPGSLARWGHPVCSRYFTEVQARVRSEIGERVYPTYCMDRFYFNGQELAKHVDRGPCEVSVTVNLSHNLDHDWPIHFDTPDGVRTYTLAPGDGIIYSGITLPHWREPMRGAADSYFHQAFFHFVRADGDYLEYALGNAMP